MALTVTLESLFVREADWQETPAEWRMLFRSLSAGPPFQAVFTANDIRDGSPIAGRPPFGESVTLPLGSPGDDLSQGLRLRVSGWERDSQFISIDDVLPAIEVHLLPTPLGRYPFPTADYAYDLTVTVGVAPASAFGALDARVQMVREMELLAAELRNSGEESYPLRSPVITGSFSPFPVLDESGLGPWFPDRDFVYSVDWLVASNGGTSPVEVDLRRLRVTVAGEDGDNRVAEWHPTFFAGTGGPEMSFSAGRSEFREGGAVTFDRHFTLPRDGSDSVILRTGGFEDDSGYVSRSGIPFVRPASIEFVTRQQMLPTSEVSIVPFDGGFQLNTFVDNGRFAYEVGWRVDFA
jgi:hypothetical protein